jgi:hypothetical protein
MLLALTAAAAALLLAGSAARSAQPSVPARSAGGSAQASIPGGRLGGSVQASSLGGPAGRSTEALDASVWSQPAQLSACVAVGAPSVAFPRDSPAHATGRGAVVWSATQRCPGGEGARVAAIGARDVPGVSTILRTRATHGPALRGALDAADAPHGQILIAGEQPGEPGREALIEGSALGPFSPLSGAHLLAPVALATAYLGDVALLAPARGAGGAQQLRLEVERYFARELTRGVPVSAAGGDSAQALTVAMDYRTDALAVWSHAGAIYARALPASGEAHPTQRLAAGGTHIRIAALLSDDDHAILAWSEQRAGETFVYLDISGAGVRFSAPRLIERFRDPLGLPAPAASPTLVRLSSESVMMAWAGSAAGRWVVRVAAIDLQGPQPASTLASPDGGQALLACLAPGPDGEALALWSEPQQSADGTVALGRDALFAARGVDAKPGRVLFDAPEQVAPLGSIAQPSVAFDPDTDRALAVWLGEGGTIDYAIRSHS